MNTEPALTRLERTLADRFQRGFPLAPRPFAAVAEVVGATEAEVLAAVQALARRGLVSRVGPVFRPGVVGASTLAAMGVPSERLAEVAAEVSRRPEVNHNYEREHRLNLWFVVTAADRVHLDRTLRGIEQATGLPVLSLPLREEYHIDLGFRIDGSRDSVAARRAPSAELCAPLTEADGALIEAIQDGLPLVSAPYAEVAGAAGTTEAAVLQRLVHWCDAGIVKRFGIVLRHRPLGFAANAMVVWNVPDDEVSDLGRRLASADFVTLCYRRARALPDWPYNLYCMIHGRDRAVVVAQIDALKRRFGLQRFATATLFSQSAFKQRGARYRFAGKIGEPVGAAGPASARAPEIPSPVAVEPLHG